MSTSDEGAARLGPGPDHVVGPVVAGFLNSRAHAGRGDRLEEAVGVLAGAAVPRAVVRQLRVVRDDLIGQVTAGDAAGGQAAWERFAADVDEVRFGFDFAGAGVGAAGRPEDLLRQTSGDSLVGALVRAVAQLVASGNWTRLRVCANEVCSGIFYDRTRSRTQRWDSYDTCGNRTNVAAYRARVGAAGPAGD